MDGCLTTRTRKASKPLDLGSDFSSYFENWQAPRQRSCRDACQFSERYNHNNTQFRGFGDFTISYGKTSVLVVNRGPALISSPNPAYSQIYNTESLHTLTEMNIHTHSKLFIMLSWLFFINIYTWVYREHVNTKYLYVIQCEMINWAIRAAIRICTIRPLYWNPFGKTVVMYNDVIDKE